MTLTTYDPATGEMKEVRTGIEPDDAILGDAAFVEGAWSPLFYRVDVATGEVVERD